MGIVEGVAEIGRDGIAVLDTVAEEGPLSIGDRVGVEFEDGYTTSLVVKGIFDDASLVGANWLIDRGLTNEHRITDGITFAGLTYAGVDPAVGQAAVEAATSAFPQLSVQTTPSSRGSRGADRPASDRHHRSSRALSRRRVLWNCEHHGACSA